ncbi:hypothetical protein QJS10_CPA03g01111 [Acorus calamus]|uniref:Reverse transcriptase domain-containing protein n=1 Tax=Acorus calamus TaxID=4465 RepID=A0AAV9FA50_ACOCL|nr:hypothetical protein QJS10_CPA03g01111 [Acorus calamus]
MVEECISTAKASVLVNGKPCGFFHINNGIRQGDPLSPLLFVIVTNVFSRVMKMAESTGWIHGLRCSQGGPRLSHVQYADDTIILSEADEYFIRGIHLICRVFSLLSGLQINFEKSAMLGINVGRQELDAYADIFQCQVQEFPVRHLGLPLHLSNFLKAEWAPMIERFEKRLEGWRGNLLSSGGHLILLQVVLSNLPIFFLSIFKIPKGIFDRIDGIRRRFLWCGPVREKKKVHLVKWEIVCSSKKQGGLGVLNLEDMNNALLSKWKWRWLTQSSLIWKPIVSDRYRFSSNQISVIPRGAPRASQIWSGILKATAHFMEAVRWKIGDGKSTLFWLDTWSGVLPLRDQFPRLFELIINKAGTVDQFYRREPQPGGWHFKMSEPLLHEEDASLSDLVYGLQGVLPLNSMADAAIWSPNPRDGFSVRGCYTWWRRNRPIMVEIAHKFKEIWKTKSPLKVRFFL